MPKLDLHRHLEGSMRFETLWEFHQKQQQTFHASYGSFVAACSVAPGATPGFRNFLACFNGLRFKYGGTEELERIAAEAVADAANDAVTHLELRFSPVFAAWRMQAPPPPGVYAALQNPRDAAIASEAIVRGARRESRARGISLSFIVTLGRFASLDINRAAVDLLTDRVGDDLAALDLAGDEAFPAAAFAPFFKRWKDAGKKITVHAGEDATGPGAQNIREAIEVLGADRIGHGVRAIDDATLIDSLARNKIALEMCPTSNEQTQAVRSLKEHPLKKLLEAGVRVTINSDDPEISRMKLSDDYRNAVEQCGLSLEQLKTCIENARLAAFGLQRGA